MASSSTPTHGESSQWPPTLDSRDGHCNSCGTRQLEKEDSRRSEGVLSPTGTFVDQDQHIISGSRKTSYESGPVPPRSPQCVFRQHGDTKEEDMPESRKGPLPNRSVPILNLEMCNAIAGLVAVTTEGEYERYDRTITFDKKYNHYIIPSYTTSFLRPPLPEKWTMFIHPEGVRYFLKRTHMLSVLTEAHVDEYQDHETIEHYISEITSFIGEHNVPLPPDPYLVLELRTSGKCGYYFVDHGKQCLFWLDTFDFSHLVDQVRIPHTASLVGLQMRSHYWYHNELFPHIYQVTDENIHEIEDMLVYAIGDVATSGPNSTINLDLDTLKLMHTMVVQFQHKDPDRRSKSVGGAWLVFRLLAAFYGERFIYLYGENGARLSPTQSIHPKWHNSWFIKAMTLIMLFGPSIHIRKLKTLTVDGVVGKPAWVKFRERLVEEWRDIVLYATVVLTANVSFLTIQSVDGEAQILGHRSHAQRSSDFSIVTSMGTIIFGLLLLRQHREAMNLTFIANRSASQKGIETLAVMYSLPYALLLWSMVSFFISFCLLWYQSNDRVVVILISVTFGLVGLLLIWGITSAYEDEPYWDVWPLRWRHSKFVQKLKGTKESLKFSRTKRRTNSIETQLSDLDPQ